MEFGVLVCVCVCVCVCVRAQCSFASVSQTDIPLCIQYEADNSMALPVLYLTSWPIQSRIRNGMLVLSKSEFV